MKDPLVAKNGWNREWKAYTKHIKEDGSIVTPPFEEVEPDFQVLRNCLGFSETAYFSMCNLSITQF